MSAPRYRVAIDGGGTGTRARLLGGKPGAAADLVLGEGCAGPSALAQGVAQAWRHIEQAVAAAFAAAQLTAPDASAIELAAGLSGAEVAAWRSEFFSSAPAYARLLLATDGTTSLLGAHGGEAGAMIACGTGVIGLALGRDGAQRTVSGWGYPLGDEGSGAWIGRHALRHAMRALDGRAAWSSLAEATSRRCGQDRHALLDWMFAAGQAEVATLAPLVFACADEDAEAARVLRRAAEEIDSVADALDPAGELPLALLGSIGRELAPRLAAPVAARLCPPQGTALDGALRLFARPQEAWS